MPIPKPRGNEGRSDFINRCVRRLREEDKDKTNEQIIAICFATWEDYKKNN